MISGKTRIRKHWIPPVSPYGLIQETLWPNEWRILVACMLLNCTTRKQVEKILPSLFKKYPDALAMSEADKDELSLVISTLGFKNRRSHNLIMMSKRYLDSSWNHASELPGIGKYGSAAWEIFIKGIMPPRCPDDHALTLYYKWRKLHV